MPLRAHAAGGAFAVDDAEIGKPGECKVESWASFASNGDFVGVAAPACVVNLGRPVEVGAAIARAHSGGAWSTGGAVRAKTNLVPVEGNLFGVGLAASAGYDFTTKTLTGANLNVPFTAAVSETFKININAGWNWDRPSDKHFATWGAGFEWAFAKPFTLITEVFGQVGPRVRPWPQHYRHAGQLDHRRGQRPVLARLSPLPDPVKPARARHRLACVPSRHLH
jgi:hypothetical protein